MSTETTTPELELAPEANVDAMKRADNSIEVWNEYRAQLEKLKTTAETLVVTDVSDKAGMKLARTTRLTLKDLRVSVEKKRKELGEEALRKTQAINATAGEIKDAISALETRLLEQEEFAERKAEEEQRLRVQRRTEQLAQYWNPALPMPDLGALSVDQFDTLLADAETTHRAKIAAAQKAREEAEAAEAKAQLRRDRSNELAPLVRFIKVKLTDLGEMTFETYSAILNDAIAAERAEKVEQERQRVENERLKKEAEEQAAALKAEQEKAAAERKAAEEKLAAERRAAEEKAAKIKAEAEAAAAKERERVAAEQEAERQRVAHERRTAELKAQKEREEIEAKARAEREKAEAAAKVERDAREKAERELAAKRAQEEAAKKAADAAAKKAARAPDREKLLALAQRVETVVQGIPSFVSPEATALRFEITTRLNDVRDWLKTQAEKF